MRQICSIRHLLRTCSAPPRTLPARYHITLLRASARRLFSIEATGRQAGLPHGRTLTAPHLRLLILPAASLHSGLGTETFPSRLPALLPHATTASLLFTLCLTSGTSASGVANNSGG